VTLPGFFYFQIQILISWVFLNLNFKIQFRFDPQLAVRTLLRTGSLKQIKFSLMLENHFKKFVQWNIFFFFR